MIEKVISPKVKNKQTGGEVMLMERKDMKLCCGEMLHQEICKS